jgi:hypothetical protein
VHRRAGGEQVKHRGTQPERRVEHPEKSQKLDHGATLGKKRSPAKLKKPKKKTGLVSQGVTEEPGEFSN